jgi:2-polyprenyl-6-methoxyphenol hydroxylase-like FAD-dependent oxidoreductase
MKDSRKTDILVVGAGPVGLTMAAELARYGLSVRIIDRSRERSAQSKAIVIWPRTLELIDHMEPGLADRFTEAGLVVCDARIFSSDEEIVHLDLRRIESPYNFALMIAQSETERLLEELLARHGVMVERQTELIHFEQGDGGVQSRISSLADGGEEQVSSAWMIGCDGAHSTVRHQLGFEFEGKTEAADWYLADVDLNLPADQPEIRVYWHSSGVLLLFPLSAERYRVIANPQARGKDENAEHPLPAPTLGAVQDILRQRGPKGIEASNPRWLSSFTVNERKVGRYYTGRVLLAGDAAHVHSPAGGQGMNTGMQDAFNLAWKLSLASRDECSTEVLCDSYSQERSAVATELLKATGRATEIALMQGSIRQFVRNHLAAAALGLEFVNHAAADVLSEINVAYAESPLISREGVDHLHPHAGHRAPVNTLTMPVGAGSSDRFVLFADAEQMPEELADRYSRLIEPGLRPAFQPGGMWLVRPDDYVAVSTREGDWQSILGFFERLTQG